MNTATKVDLEDLQSVMEALQKRLTSMDLKTKVDVAARLGAAAKTIKAIDATVKDEVKRSRKHKPGSVLGEVFKAVLLVVPTSRLNQETLKAEYPGAYEECCEITNQERVLFEPR